MGLELVTGYWGVEHVTAEQDADRNAGIVGSNCYVLPIGEQLRAEAVTSNMVRIFDGTGMAYGRQFYIEEGAYENITIENGTAGLLRNDLIVVKYKKDEASGIEGVSFEVLKGASAESATDPVANNADIRTGVFESEIPLYRVRLNGLAIEAVEPLFYVPKTVEALSKKCVELEKAVTELNGNFVSSYNGKYPALVKNNEMWLVIGQRATTSETLVAVVHMIANKIYCNAFTHTPNMTIDVNDQGTVSIEYTYNANNVYSCCLRLKC